MEGLRTNVIQSLNPALKVSNMNLDEDILFSHSRLERNQREMIAVVVSAANQSEYCLLHHQKALLRYWKDQQRVDRLIREPDSAGLTEQDYQLCVLAKELTLNPKLSTFQKVNALKQTGLADHAILDAILVVAYFNFVNRIELGLGRYVN